MFRVLFLILLVLLLLSPLPTLAQEATPEVVTSSPSPILSVPELPSQPQADDAPTADDPFIGMLLALGLVVGSIMEYLKEIFLKPWRAHYKWSEERYIQLVVAISVCLGIAAALTTMLGGSTRADLLAYIGITSLPSIIGVVMSGILIGLGSKATNEIVGWLKGITAFVRTYEISQRATTVTTNKPQVSETKVANDLASALIRESRG